MSDIFRTQNNTPPIYVESSRDFQLFCRLFDTIVNSLRFRIKTILNLTNPMKLNDRMLKLYATKVGFITDREIDANVLRYILAAFPYIIKNKGTKLGIEQAVYTILKAENTVDPPYVEVINKFYENGKFVPNKSYIINIYLAARIYNRVALEEILKYVIPAGYIYNILLYDVDSSKFTQIDTVEAVLTDSINVVKAPAAFLGGIRAIGLCVDYKNVSTDFAIDDYNDDLYDQTVNIGVKQKITQVLEVKPKINVIKTSAFLTNGIRSVDEVTSKLRVFDTIGTNDIGVDNTIRGEVNTESMFATNVVKTQTAITNGIRGVDDTVSKLEINSDIINSSSLNALEAKTTLTNGILSNNEEEQ